MDKRTSMKIEHKRILIFACGLAVGALVTGVVGLYGWLGYGSVDAQLVRFDVRNDATKPLRRFSIGEGASKSVVCAFEDRKVPDHFSFAMPAGGEQSYAIELEFADRRVLRTETYAEDGYRFNVTMGDTNIDVAAQ